MKILPKINKTIERKMRIYEIRQTDGIKDKPQKKLNRMESTYAY